MKRIIGLIVFFGLCVAGFHFRENHESTGYKETIAKLEEKVELLRDENNEINQKKTSVEGVNRQMAAKLKELGHPWEIDETEAEDEVDEVEEPIEVPEPIIAVEANKKEASSQ